MWLSRAWAGWRSSLVIVQPATVLAWHRHGFQLYWRWNSGRPSFGRPPLDAEARQLIRRMARDNPTWGRRRIQAELALLGYDMAELTVAKYMPTGRPSALDLADLSRRRTSPRWSPSTFSLCRPSTFRLLFAFVVLRHDRRELLHVNVTDHPTAAWTTQQLVDAFPDRYGSAVPAPGSRRHLRRGVRAASHGYGDLRGPTAPRAPWQNPFVERAIGSIRRECLDHFLILNEAHLRRLLGAT